MANYNTMVTDGGGGGNKSGVPKYVYDRMAPNVRKNYYALPAQNTSPKPPVPKTPTPISNPTPAPPTYKAPSAPKPPAPKPTQIIVPVPKAAPVVPTTTGSGKFPRPGDTPASIDVPADAWSAAPVDEPVDEGPTIQDMINQMIEAARQKQIAALEAANIRALTGLDTTKMGKETALGTAKTNYLTNLENALGSSMGNLDTEAAKVAPVYYDKRNQAAASSDVGALNFAQYMAGRGIKGAAGGMPAIYRNAALQGNIGALNQQEAGINDEIGRNRSEIQNAYDTNQTNVMNNYETDFAGLQNEYLSNKQGIASAYDQDVLAANAGLDAQGLQAYIDQMNSDKLFSLNEAGITGTYGGTPTLQANQFESQKAISEAGLTGTYNGQDTLQNKQFQADETYRNKSFDESVRQFQANYGLNLREMDMSEAQTKIDNAFKQGQINQQGAQQALANAKFVYQRQQDEKAFNYNAEQDTLDRQNVTAEPIGASDYKTDSAFAEDVQGVMAAIAEDPKNRTRARDQITANSKAYIQNYGYDGYQALLKLTGDAEGL